MDLIPILHSYSLDQLLTLAVQRSIPIQSKISRCIVHSDILAFLVREHSLDDSRLILINTGDPMGPNLALEVGVDSGLFPDAIGKWQGPTQDQMKVFVEKTREWLQNQGISQKYLGDFSLLSAVAAVIYERKLPTPQLFWYGLNIISHFYFASWDNFRDSFNTFLDDTPEDYLWETSNFYSDNRIFPVFLYQKTEHLLALAQSLPVRGVYFQTRIGLINYLSGLCRDNIQTQNYCLGFLSEFHEEAYPERSDLIHQVYSLPKDLQIIPSYIRKVSQDVLKALPPIRYEKEYFQILILSWDREELLNKLKEAFSVFTDNSLWKYESDTYLASEIFVSLNTDPNFQPKSRAELADLVRSKIFRKISPKVLRSLTGWEYPISDISGYIQENLNQEQFHLIMEVSACPNPVDFHLEPHQDFAISFGTFLNYVCYSPEDLFRSFQVNEHFTAFRKPDKPNDVFTSEDMDSLLNILKQYNWEDRHEARIVSLVNIIEEGLSGEFPLDLEEIAECLQATNPEDLAQAEKIFRNFFEAGMFQRTWDGLGKYPMKYEDTLRGSLEQIEMKMTPVMNNIREACDSLSEEGEKLIRSLAVVDYMDQVFVRRVDPLLSFETQTREGNFCIGYGSRLMIYSGYFYLTALGFSIPNFDLSEFDPESTHR